MDSTGADVQRVTDNLFPLDGAPAWQPITGP